MNNFYKFLFFTKLDAAFRRPEGINYDVHVGSQVFIQMPGDRVYSGNLVRYPHPLHSEITFFHVLTRHGSFTANLEPFPVQHGLTSHRVTEYRCFIPISGHRVLTAFLEIRPLARYIPGSIRVMIRVPGQNYVIYSGVMEVGEGEGPEWIPRHS